jgi:glycosyltransferase involved in cell wall biosynthesis
MLKYLHFEACDFENFPMGGTLTFAKQIISMLPEEVGLVGFVSDSEPVGKWISKTINNRVYRIYGICSIGEISKSKLPKRLYSYLKLKKNIKNIYNNGVRNIFTQTPQFVFVLSKYNWENFCFYFAGLGNSVSLSKYKFLRIFGQLYEKKLFADLKTSATRVLAASDYQTIQLINTKYTLPSNFITQFPTRYDNMIFKVIDQQICRKQLDINQYTKVFITTGRLSYIKGWQFLLDAFKKVDENISDSILIFLGDGEEFEKIENYILTIFDKNQVILAGRKPAEQVAIYLNAADVFILGSYVEGWPTSMVEALACGKPIVSTDVSGAKEMIIENQNGFVLKERDVKKFSKLMIKALSLSNPNDISIKNSLKYSLNNLKNDFEKVWLNEIL